MGERTIHRLHTQIAGVAVTWTTDCAGETDELRRILKHHLRDPQKDAGGESHTVEFAESGRLPVVPDDSYVRWEGPYMGLVTSRNKVKWLYSPSTGLDYLILTEEITIVHDTRCNHTCCHLLARREGDRTVRPRIWDAIVILLHTVMAIHGRYSLHAAAVGLDGGAYVFIGESGHGKSTLCTDLVNLGADYMGDDLAYVYPRGDTVCIGSLLMEAKLFPRRHAREKEWIDVVETTGCRAPLELPLRRIYYLQRAKGPCRVEPQEPADCMIAMIRASNNVRMQYDADRWQDVLERASMLDAFGVFHFGDRSTLSTDLFTDA